MALADLVQSALATGRDAANQASDLVLIGKLPGYYDEVTARQVNGDPFTIACPNAVVLPYKLGGGVIAGGADLAIEGAKILTFTRKVLLSQKDLGTYTPKPDDELSFENAVWGVVGVAFVGGLFTLIVTR